MSILDKLRGRASKAKEQADHVVEQHGDKIATGIEKTGEVASKVTGHRFDEKIDKGVNKAKERFEQHDDEAADDAPPSTTTPPSTATPPTASDVAEPATDETPTTDPGTGQDKGPTA
jgi:MT0933-like antitoxin protein